MALLSGASRRRGTCPSRRCGLWSPRRRPSPSSRAPTGSPPPSSWPSWWRWPQPPGRSSTGGTSTSPGPPSPTLRRPGPAPTRPGPAGGSAPGPSARRPPRAAPPDIDVNAVAAKVQPGMVDIYTQLSSGLSGAGTGIILTPDGEVLTNNHVIEGSTSISVEHIATGQRYTAVVVGVVPSEDLAVLQIQGAFNLPTVPLGRSSTVKVGDPIVALGNAGGVGGTPHTVSGTVQALNQTITATDVDGSHPETLSGLIQIDAPLEPGDSGGPADQQERSGHRHQHRRLGQPPLPGGRRLRRLRHPHRPGRPSRRPDRGRAGQRHGAPRLSRPARGGDERSGPGQRARRAASRA